MSTTHHGNGTIRLTNFAELGNVRDLLALPDAPAADLTAAADVPAAGEQRLEPSAAPAGRTYDLADLIAQLASVSGGLETMAREDARAREQATVELARYQALLAERDEAERALAEARRVRDTAEHLAVQAFTDETRAQAAQHAAAARAAELHCTELLAERTREAEELASRPHLTRCVAEQRRLAQEQRDATRQAETERADRLARGLAAVNEALTHDRLDEAQKLLEPLAREFSDDATVRSRADTIRWQLRQRIVAPAESALRDVLRRPYRDDPEAAVARLAELHTSALPDDLARRVFGLWSNACFRVVQLRGWHEPHREAPLPSRGAVWARPELDAPWKVVSSLDEPKWQPGQTVPERIAVKAPLLEAGTAHRRGSANSSS